jgi:hypothetical protein
MQKKSQQKLLYILGNTKKQISGYTIVLPFTVRNLSFLHCSKYKVFLTGIFCKHHPYISIYIFNVIIFWDLEIWDFKIFKKLKVRRAWWPRVKDTFRLIPSVHTSIVGVTVLDTKEIWPDVDVGGRTYIWPYRRLAKQAANQCSSFDSHAHPVCATASLASTIG